MSHHYNHYRHHPHYRTNMEFPEESETTAAGQEDVQEDVPQVQPEESQQEPAQPEDIASNELEELKKEIQDERLRMAAEMDNYRKRLEREQQEQKRYAAEKVLGDLLPALDNLDLAIQYGSEHEACASMMQGIEMTRKLLVDAIAKNGLVVFGEEGETFDPALHEAIGVEARPDMEKGAIARVFQRGYKLNDRVLRPAKVMVNN